jgi:hypothetical protein
MRRTGWRDVTRDSEPGVSARVGLARVAEAAIARIGGVTPTAGPAGRWQTVGSQQAIRGVLAVEDPEGRVHLELHLAVSWPPQMPLEQLGAQVRAHVRRSAAMAGTGARLGSVAVAFDDVLTESA